MSGMPAPRPLLADLPSADATEHFETLLRRPGCRVERIVSRGQASPPGFWYDQPHDEWVLLLSGAARIGFAPQGEVALSAGDSLLLPAHCRHCVAWTASGVDTVWLALHFD